MADGAFLGKKQVMMSKFVTSRLYGWSCASELLKRKNVKKKNENDKMVTNWNVVADVAKFDSESKTRWFGCYSDLCVLESSWAPTRQGAPLRSKQSNVKKMKIFIYLIDYYWVSEVLNYGVNNT